MVEWYAIEIDPHNLPMCTDLYKCLRNELNCEELAGSSLYRLVTGGTITDNPAKVYIQIVKDFRGWRYTGLYVFYSSLQEQAIVLTTNEFYSRFLQRTVTL